MLINSLDALAFENIEESVYFPAVAQGHHGNNNNTCHKIGYPQFEQNGSAKINGTSGSDLQFCSSNLYNGLPNDGCDTASGGDGYCSVTGGDIRGLHVKGHNKFKYSSGAGGSIGWCKADEEFTWGGGVYSDFNNLSLYASCTMTFSPNHSEYRINSVSLGQGAKLILSSGDYWVKNLTLNQGAEVVLLGDARIFVWNESTLSDARINESNGGNLLLFGYDDITLDSNTTLSGNVYSDYELEMNGTSLINGRVTARYLEMNARSQINGETIEPPLPPVLAQCPAGQANVPGITYRTYDATGWKPGVETSPVDHDEFNDLIATVKNTQEQLGESIEQSAEGDTRINPHISMGDYYAGIFEGYIDIPETGRYTFGIDGDDAIELLIDDQVLVGYYDRHPQCDKACETGKISLEKGTHKIEVRFHEATGGEGYHLYWQGPSASSLVKVPESAYLTCPSPQFEYGRVELAANGTASITFDNSYATPPVVMVMPTIDGAKANNDGPSTLRVSSVSSSEASIAVENPPNNKTAPKAMPELDYFVMEPGYLFLERRKALQAGKVSTKKYQGKRLSSSGEGYESITFEHSFGAKPAMLGQTLSRTNNRFITAVIGDVDDSGTGFDIAIEASEVSGSINSDETLGYVAGLGSGVMTIGGEQKKYEFGYAINNNGTGDLSQQCKFTNGLQNSYPSLPYTIANKNSRDGGDGGWLRRCRHNSFNNTLSFGVDEDQQLDDERTHMVETVGYFAFEAPPEPLATNHYRIEFTSGALSCAAKAITVRACADDDCTSESPLPSSVELYKGTEKYSDLTFTGSTQTDLWHMDGGSVLLGLGVTNPTGPYRCYIDGALVDNSACLLTFEDTGLYFDVPDTQSCKTTAEFEVYAVTKDTQSQQCKPLFANESRSIDFSFDYDTPNNDDVNNRASLTLNSLNSPTSAVIPGGKSKALSVKFDANGKGKLSATYPEAGKVKLEANLTYKFTPPGAEEQELELTHSDKFVAAPAGFHFFNPKKSKRCNSGDLYDSSCEILAAAGANFSMQVKAVCWESDDKDFSNNTALQNFVYSELPIHSVIDQPAGGSAGKLGVDKVNFILDGGKTAKLVSNQTWNEVGTMKVGLSGNFSYQGVTITSDKSSSEVFGRFTPAYLGVTGNKPTISHSCDTFTYMDQPFAFNGGAEPWIQVKGYAVDGVDGEGKLVSHETVNYQKDAWWRFKDKKLDDRNQWSQRSYTSTVGTIEDSAGTTKSGVVNYYTSPNRAILEGAQVQYARAVTPVAPFNADFNLVLHKDDVTDEDGICFKSGSSGECLSFTSESINKDADGKVFELRYGRLLLDNGYSPQSESLRLPLRTEYVSAVTAANIPTWITNAQDSCSVYNTVTSKDIGEIAATGMNMTLPADFPAITAHSNAALTLQSGTVLGGVQQLYFTAPNTPGEVRLKQHVSPWLKWYWNYDGNKPNDLYDPRASAFFGTYRGHDKVIYWREVN